MTISGLVAGLVQLKVDALVSPVTAAIRAAKQATKTIPIVMVTGEDPVATGLVHSLAHPGENITGITRLTRELAGKTVGIASGGGSGQGARRRSRGCELYNRNRYF